MAKRNGSGNDGLPHTMRPAQAAEYLSVSVSTLGHWRSTRSGPPYVRFGTGTRAVVTYKRADLDAWIDANRIAVGDS